VRILGHREHPFRLIEHDSGPIVTRRSLPSWMMRYKSSPYLSPMIGAGPRAATVKVMPCETSAYRSSEAPSRWLAGADVVGTFEGKANDLLAHASAYRDLSSSLAFDQGGGPAE
jgi:hypothetical protein